MLRFSGCALDTATRTLLRDGHVAPLEPQALDVLIHLVDNRDRIVTKEELLDTVWGDRWVSESAVTTRIKEIRRAVGDSGDSQQVVRTVRGSGYQFVAPIDEQTASVHAPLGRQRDVAELSARLRPGSLVTVVGPGGVGKTTLGRSLAAGLVGSYPDGCLTIDLTVLPSSKELTGAVARAAQLVEATPTSLPELLRRRHALLLLDDADELVADVARLCSDLAGPGSHLAVLVTCRERLGLPDEQIWPLLPLERTDSVGLLRRRAADLAPLGSIVDADGSTLADLAQSVDHLPLALEMLASASAYLGIEDLRDLVANRPELLTDPRRGAPRRHGSLDVLVNDSLDRLDPPSRELMTGVSVFAGSFSLVDAASMCSATAGGLDDLRSLVDRSLLSPSVAGPRGPRFQLLRTVSRAVDRRTDTASRHIWRERHATWLARELERADHQLRGGAETAGVQRFNELTDDARLAHAWAREHDVPLALAMTASLHLFAHSRLWGEPAQWAGAIPDWLSHPRAVAAVASQASQQGYFDQARDLGERIVALDDPLVRAWALEVLSDVAIYLGELEQAENWAGQLIALGAQHADPRMSALGTTNAALAAVYSGDADRGLALLDAYPGSAPRSSALTDAAWLEFARGEAHATAGRTSAALGHFERAKVLGLECSSPFVAGVAQSSIAGLQHRAGDLSGAALTYGDLIATFSRHGIITHLTITLRNAVQLMATLGHHAEAAMIVGWVLGPDARAGYGPELAAMLQIRQSLRDAHGDRAVDDWERGGLGLTASSAADLALASLGAGTDVQGGAG